MILTGLFGSASIKIDEIEPQCEKQIRGFLNHLAFTERVVIMPDTHAGKGSVIGFTMPIIPERIIPNVIGVDINCGMLAINTGRKDLGIDLPRLDSLIRTGIPFGMTVHDIPIIDFAREFPWKDAKETASELEQALEKRFGFGFQTPSYDMEWFRSKCRDIGMDERRAIASIGTLGGGNHFIEFGRSAKTDEIWLVIHTGSRGFGAKIADYWQKIATDVVRRRRSESLHKRTLEIRQSAQGSEIAERIQVAAKECGLAKKFNDNPAMDWLDGNEAAGYFSDMVFAQAYATFNRHTIARIIAQILQVEATDEIETAHNYIDFRDLIIRKGAIRSYSNERMIIPFNMQDGILICEGKSNAEWNYSAPHGAGRCLSRSDARKKLDLNVFRDGMEGASVFSTSVCASTLDEAPGAYKPMEVIEEAIRGTANTLDRLRPIHNLKDKAQKPKYK